MAEIRVAESRDARAIAEIMNELLATTTYEWSESPHTPEERDDWLTDRRVHRYPVLVAVLDNEVVGCASYGDFRDSQRWPGYRATVEHSIHVRRDHWRLGLGRELLRALIEHARTEGKHVMVAGIDSENVDSLQFHARLGFVEVARMPETGTKFGRWLDLVLMQRVLDAPL